MNINEELSSAIFNIGRLIREKINLDCSANFTQSEIEILKFVEKNKFASMKAIADYLHIKPSSATFLIGNLARKGIIKRAGNKKDRRMIYVVLTAGGLKSLQKKYKTIHKTIGSLFGELSNKDKKTLINIFTRLNSRKG